MSTTSTSTYLPIGTIPLNKLVPWEGNVRKTGANDGIDELKASIAAHGILQSLVVRKSTRGKYAIVAGQRRYLALSALAKSGNIETDTPVPCHILSGAADAKEISLTENTVRAPMHPADQFEAFRDLIDSGSAPADIAARFGITEAAVKQRLRLARVSPEIFAAYREGKLNLEQVQAFAVSDDHAAQERVFADLSDWNDDADSIRSALTEGEITATDKRARFVSLAAYEAAGGPVRRDLFAEGDDGVFLLDAGLLSKLAMEKLQLEAETVKTEGWQWVEAVPEFDYVARGEFRMRRPEPLPLSEEATEESRKLSEEYATLFDNLQEGDEETSARLDEIEARIAELEETESAYTPEVIAIAGAVVTIGSDGELEIVRGLVRPEDEPERESSTKSEARPEFSAALIESLTEHKSAAISASLTQRPDIALAAVVHSMALGIFHRSGSESSLQISAKVTYLREESKGVDELERARERWLERIPADETALWDWCLTQDQETLLELLAYCAALTLNAVRTKQDRSDPPRIAHANALANALGLDMPAWFTPTAENFFGRVGRETVISALVEARGAPAKRSWQKLKKSELAILAEREIAGTSWLPQPVRL
jgi:ParB family transcriptional regulator, chromosome partitioning protein